VVTLRGAGSQGHDPLTVGAGADPALSLQIPVSQTANAFQIEQPEGTIVGGLSTARVALTAAQLQAMNGAPVQILPAPGAGKTIVPQSVAFLMTRTATAYTGGGAIQLQYHTTTTSVAHTGTIPATVLTTAGAGKSTTLLGDPSGASGTPLPVNEGIDITNATAAFATGTGTAVVLISYAIISTP